MDNNVKMKLLKRYSKQQPGDIVEIRPATARVLRAVGIAEDFVEPTPAPIRGRTTTRVMQPTPAPTPEPIPLPIETDPEEENSTSASTSASASEAGFGRTPYNRRDMQPEE